MQGAPEKANGEVGLPTPHAVYDCHDGITGDSLHSISALQEEVVRVGILS